MKKCLLFVDIVGDKEDNECRWQMVKEIRRRTYGKSRYFNSILRGNAVLITGSGAHLNVMTPHGEMFPSGVNLLVNYIIYVVLTIQRSHGICRMQQRHTKKCFHQRI